jgi:hypothetical protein
MRWRIGIALVCAAGALAGGAAALAGAPTTAGNRLIARRDARRLLRFVVLPTGATRLSSAPAGDGGLLRRPASEPGFAQVVDRSELWSVPASLDSVVTFIESHVPSGGASSGSGQSEGPGIPDNEELTVSFPAIPGRVGTRWLAFTAVALPDGATGVRVDAETTWIVTRSPLERVPAGVQEIDVSSGYPGKAPNVSLSVTDPAKIGRIVHWIDGLGIVQPGEVFSCPALFGPTVTFAFRAAAGGAVLARAQLLDLYGFSGPCNPIGLTILGHTQTPLIGGDFLERVQRLLGVQFEPPAIGRPSSHS